MRNKLQEKLQKLTGMEDASDFLVGSITDVSELYNIKAKDGSLIIDRTTNKLYLFDNNDGWVSITGGAGGGIGSLVEDTSPQLGGDLDTNGNLIDGRDIATDGTKLDTIETGADVTDTANVTAAGALMDSEVTNLAQVKAFDSSDYATAAQGVLADSAQQPPSEGAFVNGDKTKLDSIETSADVTDETNVIAALDGATIPDAGTPASGDKVLIQDVSDSDNLKYVNISDLPSGGGSGDMVAATYDPNTVEANVYDVDNHISGTTNKVYTAAEQTKLSNIEVNADVTDEANVVSSLDGATLTAVTVASADKVIVQDASDSDNIKTVTAQSIADLGAGGGIADIVEDTTPQLGGNLDLNGNTVGDASSADLTKLSELTATSAELNYVDGVTSNIQTQLDTKTTVSSGSGTPGTTPTKVGDMYVDTTDDIVYVAIGTASSADWQEQALVDGTSLADGEILVWDASNSKFVRDPRVTGTGTVTAVDMNSIMGNFYSTTTASTTGTLTLNNAVAGGRTTIRIQNATAGGPTISGSGITVTKMGDWSTNYDTTNVNTIYIEMVTATLAWAWITAVD